MKVQILIDNKTSWIINYSMSIIKQIRDLGHETKLIFNSEHVEKGDVLFLLSCEKIFKKLELNKHNIVIHESKLPKGKGFSPLTWQVLEGKNEIPITLFEADSNIDSGDIYLQEIIHLEGNELIDEIREKQVKKTIKLVLKFLKEINKHKPMAQTGEESVYKRRHTSDSLLDINKTIKEQFNLLRVADNDRYPAYFKRENTEYIIKIFKKDSNE